MTAPRMTDEAVVEQWADFGTGNMTALETDHRRARSSESALLARVERLERLVSALLKAGPADAFVPALAAEARAALSEKP